MSEEIPYGYCHCGCGALTATTKQNLKRDNITKGEPRRFLWGHNLTGVDHPNWVGGRNKNGNYWVILLPNHPRADKKGYVFEHILVVEKALGKPLPPGAVVHHTKDTRDNDSIVICQDQGYHLLLHRRKRAYEACGHADWRKCNICHQYDSPDKLAKSGHGIFHKDCLNAYNRRYRHERRNRKD